MTSIDATVPFEITSGNKRLFFDRPRIMGILNLTPDSFFDGGKYALSEAVAINRVKEMVAQGADIIDIGAASSRPGATIIDPQEEQERLLPFLSAIRKALPEIWISVDTYHSTTARMCLEAGVDLINDISGGNIDANLYKVLGEFKVPYILMHMKGVPGNMQTSPQYENLMAEMSEFFKTKIKELQASGVEQVILDPGFGFGKSLEHNYTVLKNLGQFRTEFNLPLMVGISRKSMINKVIGTKPEDALNGTTALHMIALLNGAEILRVHDVKEAKQTIQLYQQYKSLPN
jgi:dihydropteroate synthase